MSSLLKYSEEQHAVVIELEKGNNVCVQAVAGSGKTTTCLHIAESFPERNILLLTYNAKLKMETRRKVDSSGITNMEVHSFHAFCVKYLLHLVHLKSVTLSHLFILFICFSRV
jgi:superfamily I DNA/RNA helicase